MARMEVAIRGVDAPFVVRGLHVVDRLSTWFEIDVIAQSYAADLDLDAAIWTPALACSHAIPLPLWQT